MPPVKICPYCDYTTGSTNCLNPHVFKNHKNNLYDALRTEYIEYNIPIAPFTIPVAKYDKRWIICLCCNEVWTSRTPYDKHIVNSKGACVPANQLIALQQATGLKFSEKAKEQTANTSIQKQQAEAIEKLMAIIAKMKEDLLRYETKLNNLDITVRITKPWLTAPAQNAIIPPSPTPQSPPKPVAKPPIPNQILSDSDEEDDEEESSVDESPPKSVKPEIRCVHATQCGDSAMTRDFDLLDCKKCKIPVCRICVRRAGANSLNPYCSAKCKAN
jgi:hypothetical protein